ncbi:hypothetical protein [Halorussus litoreus]|uniref:hypothetical protein n=1 Tax=Halorussus litoreus TaxID=1710536 RepID=UPI0013002B05|nr:hypothetical protein [Halorussus litoreus]
MTSHSSAATSGLGRGPVAGGHERPDARDEADPEDDDEREQEGEHERGHGSGMRGRWRTP